MEEYKPGALSEFLGCESTVGITQEQNTQLWQDIGGHLKKLKVLESKRDPNNKKLKNGKRHKKLKAARREALAKSVTAANWETGEISVESVQNRSEDDNLDEHSRRRLRHRKARQNDPNEAERTIFVGNVPVETNKSALQNLFKQFGKIESVRFRSVVSSNPKLPKKAAFIKKEFDKKVKAVNAYVKFESTEAAKAAESLNGELLGERHLRVDLCSTSNQNKNRYDVKRTVFLGNLAFEADEEQVRNHFDDCGEMEGVRLVRHRDTTDTKGIGYVYFKDPSSVELALKLNGEQFLNRELRVTRAVRKVKEKGPEKTKGWHKNQKLAAVRTGKTFFQGGKSTGRSFGNKPPELKGPPKHVRMKIKKEKRKQKRERSKSLMK